MMPYTTGNWTIESQHVDSISTAKNYSIVDTDFNVEYTKSEKPTKRKPQNDTEFYLSDISGSALAPAGSVIIGRSKAANVYSQDIDIEGTAQLPQKGGHKVYLQSTMKYTATNSVSGIEYQFPIIGSVAITVPDANVVTEDALRHYFSHLISLFFTEGSSAPDLLTAMFRGDLDPTQ